MMKIKNWENIEINGKSYMVLLEDENGVLALRFVEHKEMIFVKDSVENKETEWYENKEIKRMFANIYYDRKKIEKCKSLNKAIEYIKKELK